MFCLSPNNPVPLKGELKRQAGVEKNVPEAIKWAFKVAELGKEKDFYANSHRHIYPKLKDR